MYILEKHKGQYFTFEDLYRIVVDERYGEHYSPQSNYFFNYGKKGFEKLASLGYIGKKVKGERIFYCANEKTIKLIEKLKKRFAPWVAMHLKWCTTLGKSEEETCQTIQSTFVHSIPRELIREIVRKCRRRTKTERN